MKKVPLGIQDFKKIRESDYYYVDKTGFIDAILEKGAEVTLFTRPRRFGKSMNLSMLDAYLNMEYSGNTWFDGLDIDMKRPDDADKNSNPVIFLDMKNLGNGTFEQFLYKMRTRMTALYIEKLKPDNAGEIEHDPDMLFPSLESAGGIVNLTSSLYDLTRDLNERTGKNVVVLIDEYDNIVNNASDDVSNWPGSENKTHRRLILDFLRDFLGEALKGNKYLKFAVMTGVMRISKESIFSGLNNLAVDSVFRTTADESFGFTDSEIKGICTEYERLDKYDEIREWYDGYRFGNADVYNPWSVMSYVAQGFVPDIYWAGTSGNDIIDSLLDGIDADAFDSFTRLGRGEQISLYVNENVVYADLVEGGRNIITLMTMSGYLSAQKEDEPGFFSVSIPNKEMSIVFKEKFTDRLGRSGDRIRSLSRIIINGDANELSESLSGFIMSIDPKVMSHEHAYEILCIALMMHLEGPYDVRNEMHSGKGYCDILLRSNRRNLPHVLIELKRNRSENPDLDSLADDGLRQIHDMAYTHGLKGPVHLYGVAFSGTDVATRHELVQL